MFVHLSLYTTHTHFLKDEEQVLEVLQWLPTAPVLPFLPRHIPHFPTEKIKYIPMK